MSTEPRPDVTRLTRGLRHGLGQDESFGAVVPPLNMSTTYRFHDLGEPGQYDYSRSGNPTRTLLAEALTTLEGGAGTVISSSGMSAATLITLALVPNGGRVVAPHDLYGGTWRLFQRLAEQGRLSVDFVDLTNLDTAAAALNKPADLVLIETPSNPLLRITDIAAVSVLAHAAGAMVVADNTFCSPVLQQPLSLGADIVMHSATKFINGHSDVIAGAVVAGTPELHETLAAWANTLGVTASAFDSWLALRGLRTLSARMRVHQENALALIEVLSNHEAVKVVHHPALPDHPGHELAAKQQSGFGSLLSFELVGGYEAAQRFVNGLTCFDLAESLGGVESLVAHPASMTHLAMPPEVQQSAGITDGLLRLSVGIEAALDLVADITAALDRAATSHL